MPIQAREAGDCARARLQNMKSAHVPRLPRLRLATSKETDREYFSTPPSLAPAPNVWVMRRDRISPHRVERSPHISSARSRFAMSLCTSQTLQNYKDSQWGRGRLAKMFGTSQRDWTYRAAYEKREERLDASRERSTKNADVICADTGASVTSARMWISSRRSRTRKRKSRHGASTTMRASRTARLGT